jgi:hypothetical protein
MSKLPVCPASGKNPAVSIHNAANEALDPLGDTEGPPSPHSNPTATLGPQSHLLLRDDGAVLVSLEEADDRDLGDRAIVRCIVLQGDELAQARAAAANGCAAGVTILLGALPRRKP